MKTSSVLMMFTLALAVRAKAEKVSVKVHVLPAPPSLTATVEFTEPSGNRMLDAEETGALVVTVANGGEGDAFDVKVVLTPSRKLEGLQYDGRVALGTIASGKSVRRKIPLRATEALPASELTFDVAVREANGFDADPLRIAFRTKAFEPPKLVVADMGIEDQSGNSRVEPMENVELTIRVQNVGQGDARGVTVDVVNGENVFIGGEGKTHFDIGSLKAGEYHDISFMFYTNKRIKNGERIPIDVKIGEARPQFATSEGLDLTMNARQKATREIRVAGIESPRKPIEPATGLSVDVDMEIPEGKGRAGRYDVAVVIGNRHYDTPGVPEVAYADRDARIVKEYLLRTFGFREENIIYEEDATLSKFNEIFGTTASPGGKLHDWIRPGRSRVFIYYAGHGAPDLQSHEAYFVPSDANPQHLATMGYRLKTFYQNLSRLDAKDIMVVLDACFSGNANGEFIFKGISPVGLKVRDDITALGKGSVLSGGAVDQVTTWYPEKRHSLFTYFFLKGIGGAADVNGDRSITIREMRAYLDENVPYMARRLKGLDQTPVVRGPEDEVLVLLK